MNPTYAINDGAETTIYEGSGPANLRAGAWVPNLVATFECVTMTMDDGRVEIHGGDPAHGKVVFVRGDDGRWDMVPV